MMSYFDHGGKRGVEVWHRRGGKDLVSLHQECKMAHERKSVYWHFFPSFEQGRRSIWEGFTKDGERILEQVFPGFLDPKRADSIVKRKNESQMFIELKCGSLWRMMGSDRTENVGAGPGGVTFSEYSLCKPSVWDFVRPMLRENSGWANFIFTPRGKNHGFKIAKTAQSEPGWFYDVQTVLTTGLQYASNNGDKQLDAFEMMEEERREGMPDALIRQEYLCDFSAANVGAVYGDLLEQLEKQGAFAHFDGDRDMVYTSWDLGIADNCSIWFWRINGRGSVDFLDFYESNGKPIEHYFQKLDELAKGRGYRYVKHWLPHDARARTLATGLSIQNLFEARYGRGSYEIGPELSIVDGIQAARWALQQDVRFHPRCEAGLDALKFYSYEWDEEKKVFSNKPRHDWSSHCADAFRYGAIVMRVSELLKPKPKAPTVSLPGQVQGISLEMLWKAQTNRRG